MTKRRRRGPAKSSKLAECRDCGAKVRWLPEREDYRRAFGPVNALPSWADRWPKEHEHNVKGWTETGLEISGVRVDNAEEADIPVRIFTRHRCEKDAPKPGRRDVPADQGELWGADRQMGSDR